MNARNIILISQGSTASSLDPSRRQSLRLAPNDEFEGAAIAALMHAGDIDTLIPIGRNRVSYTSLAAGRDCQLRLYRGIGGISAPR